MIYSGIGINTNNSNRKPKQVFKPVFEQLSKGEHPIASNNKSFSKTWAEFRQKVHQDEKNDANVSKNIYLATAFIVMTALIISMI